jgi:hypothetical protein
VTDLAKLRRDLADHDVLDGGCTYDLRVHGFIAAARAYADLLENGRQVQRCEVHLADYHDGAPGCVFWMFAKVVEDRYGTMSPRPCNVVSKLLIELPE